MWLNIFHESILWQWLCERFVSVWLWIWLFWLDRVSHLDTFIWSGVMFKHIFWIGFHGFTHILDWVSRFDTYLLDWMSCSFWVWIPCNNHSWLLHIYLRVVVWKLYLSPKMMILIKNYVWVYCVEMTFCIIIQEYPRDPSTTPSFRVMTLHLLFLCSIHGIFRGLVKNLIEGIFDRV